MLLGLSQNFGTSFTPTLGFYYLYPGTLAIVYPGYILMSHVPCTPPLLLLGLSQNLVHLSPQLWDFIMCTLVHWYTGTLDIVYPGYIASGTLVHLYPGTLSCTMYPCTPPLLLLGLSQNFGTSFTPTLRIYYMNFFLKTKIFPKPPENIYTMYGNIYFNIWVNLV